MKHYLKYVTEVRSDDDRTDLPEQAIFEIDIHKARRIAVLARTVQQLEAHKIEQFDYSTIWLRREAVTEADVDDPDNQISVDCDTLIVFSDSFAFGGYIKHTPVHVLTERQSIPDLCAYFGIDPEKPQQSAIDFVEQVARLRLWDWSDNDGNLVSECEEPAEGWLDSHVSLMELIESARTISGHEEIPGRVVSTLNASPVPSPLDPGPVVH